MELPVELFGVIARHSQRQNLCSLCLVSRFWHAVAIRELYACVDMVDVREQQAVITFGFLWAVLSKHNVGSYVQSLDIDTWTLTSWSDSPNSKPLFAHALRTMLNLRHIGVNRVLSADPACEKALFSLERIDSFHAGSCAPGDMDRILSGLPPLRRFAWGDAGQYTRVEPPPSLLRSSDTLEYLNIHLFDFRSFIRGNPLRFPRLQVLLTAERLDLANLRGPNFASLTYISAHSFDSPLILGQPDFLPRLRFMQAGHLPDSGVFILAPSQLEAYTFKSPKRILRHLTVNVSSEGNQIEASQLLSDAIAIFENVEMTSLAMDMGFFVNCDPALRALKELRAAINLRVLSLRILSYPPRYETYAVSAPSLRICVTCFD